MDEERLGNRAGVAVPILHAAHTPKPDCIESSGPPHYGLVADQYPLSDPQLQGVIIGLLLRHHFHKHGWIALEKCSTDNVAPAGCTNHCGGTTQDTIGFNLAGLRYLKRELEVRDIKFFDDQTKALKNGPKKKRKIVKT